MLVKKKLSDNLIYSKTVYRGQRQLVVYLKIAWLSMLIVGTSIGVWLMTHQEIDTLESILLLIMVGTTYTVFTAYILSMKEFIKLTENIVSHMGHEEVVEFSEQNKYKIKDDSRLKVFNTYIELN